MGRDGAGFKFIPKERLGVKVKFAHTRYFFEVLITWVLFNQKINVKNCNKL